MRAGKETRDDLHCFPVGDNGGPHSLQVQPRKPLCSSESSLWTIPSCQAHPQLWHPAHGRVTRKVCTRQETTELVNCLFPSQEPSQPNPTSKMLLPQSAPSMKTNEAANRAKSWWHGHKTCYPWNTWKTAGAAQTYALQHIQLLWNYCANCY